MADDDGEFTFSLGAEATRNPSLPVPSATSAFTMLAKRKAEEYASPSGEERPTSWGAAFGGSQDDEVLVMPTPLPKQGAASKKGAAKKEHDKWPIGTKLALARQGE